MLPHISNLSISRIIVVVFVTFLCVPVMGHGRVVYSPGIKVEWDFGEEELNYNIENSVLYGFSDAFLPFAGGVIGVNLNRLFEGRFLGYGEIETGVPVLGVSVGKYFGCSDGMYFRGFFGAFLYLSLKAGFDSSGAIGGCIKAPLGYREILKSYTGYKPRFFERL